VTDNIEIIASSNQLLGINLRNDKSRLTVAALPYLLKGTGAVATIPTHAAKAIAGMTGLKMVACPLAFPGYPVELAWRTSSMRDVAVVKVHAAIIECLEGVDFE
jgi:LysR family transcriptional regulator, mexEF-oprN operon transcriptional activator